MGVNKNFVVKYGLEVGLSTDGQQYAVLADYATRNVGIGTSVPKYKFHVTGGIGATFLNVTGISSVVDIRGTRLNYTGIGTIATFNATNAYVNTGVTTTLSGIALNYSGISTIQLCSGDSVVYRQGYVNVGVVTNLRGTNVEYTGISTFNQTYINIGVSTDHFTFREYTQTGIVTTLTGTNLNYSGFSTFSAATGPLVVGNGGTTGNNNQVLMVTGIRSEVYLGGYVGIGTTNTGDRSPLHIKSNPNTVTSQSVLISPTDGTNASLIELANGSSGGIFIGRQNSSGNSDLISNSSPYANVIGVNTNTPLILVSDSLDRGRLDSAGNFLIGVGNTTGTVGQPLQIGSASTVRGAYISGAVGIATTLATNVNLDVVGSIRNRTGNYFGQIGGVGFNALYGGETAITGAGISLHGSSHATQPDVTIFTNRASIENARIDFNGNVLIGVARSTGVLNQPLQIGSATTAKGAYISGNVGIGTSIPSSKLSVVQTSDQSTSETATHAIAVRSGLADRTLYMGYDDGVDGAYINVAKTGSTQPLFVQTRNISSANAVVGIATTIVTGTPSQNLQVRGGAFISTNTGIGTTNPFSLLHVMGNAIVTGVTTVGLLQASSEAYPGIAQTTAYTNASFGRGWALAPGINTSYYRIATLPPSASGVSSTFDHLVIEGSLGGWDKDNLTPFKMVFSNRGGFDYKYESYGGIRTDVRILGIRTNTSQFSNTGDAVDIWVQHDRATATKLTYNVTNSIQAVVYSNPTSQVNPGLGTAVFDSAGITSSTFPRYIIDELDRIGIGSTNTSSRLTVFGDLLLTGTGIGTIPTIRTNNLGVNVAVATDFYAQNIYANTGIVTTIGITTANITNSYIQTNYINTGFVTTITGSNINYTGVGTIAALRGTNINYTGISTFTTIDGTTADFNTLYSNTGIVTTIGITTANITNSYINNNYNNVGIVTTLSSGNINVSGITTSNSYYVGATQVISSARQLQNIVSFDVVTSSSITGVITGTIFPYLNVVGVISALNGPVLIGTGQTTNTAGQVLQVAGIRSDAYIGGTLGIGATLINARLQVVPTGSQVAGLFSGTSSTDMVRITQLGTGNALVVEDEANPDTTPFVVSNAGSLGIGTNNPLDPLHLQGTMRFDRFVTPQDHALMRFFRATTEKARIGLLGADDAVYFNATNNDTANHLVIKASGNVGVAMSLPTSKLHVTGDARVTGVMTAGTFSGSGASLNSIPNGALTNSTISGISLGGNLGTLTINSTYLTGTSYDGSGAVTLSINATPANTASYIVARNSGGGFNAGIITCTDLNSTSDANLKTNIQPISNALEIATKLEGVKFEWKETNKPSIGVIAQQIEEVLPELVSTAENKTVNYNGLIGVLIEAIKELKAEVDELKSSMNK
jgi:hypothetical protein